MVRDDAHAYFLSKAACTQDVDPDMFFGDSDDPEELYGDAEARIARRICSDCPVREYCLEYAFENDIEYGIFGGLDPKERSRLKKRLRA